MLRIAVVTHYFPSSIEPWQGRSAYQTLRVLARMTDLHVFCAHPKYPSLLNPRRARKGKLDSTFSPPDVEASYHTFPSLPLVSRPTNGLMAAHVLSSHVRTFAPDLIFSFILYPDSYAGLKIARSLGVPLAAMSIGSDINRIGDSITARLTRTVLREADALLTVSDDLRVKAVAMGAPSERAHAVVNGCDLGVFHPRDRLEARRTLGIDAAAEAVVYIGRTDLRKGLRELVEAAALVRPQRPNLHVYLVGEGPDRSIIQNAIADVKASSYIHVLPPCTFDDVAVWMAAADVATLPSYMEGCPNVVLEALACGRPVVATRVGGIPEIMDDTCGCQVPPRDAQALAQGLSSVLERTWDAAEISASHSRSWDSVAGELLTLFEALVSTR
jgi:teichuronic acid biosynthesis glycosyltransferase TuaC